MAPLAQMTPPDSLVDPAIDLVADWLTRATQLSDANDQKNMDQLRDVITDDDGVAFVMRFVDRVARPDSNRAAATQLVSLIDHQTLPDFLSRFDKILLHAGKRVAPVVPNVVMPLARKRMRAIVGHLVAPAEPNKLATHLQRQQAHGYALNVNLLGEAVLGEREAQARLDRLLALLEQPDVDYVSVKISAIASQLNHWDFDESLRRVKERSALLLDRSAAVSPPTFVNFDMEEYHDLELTLRAFMDVLSEPARVHLDAGIVLQTYLPDSFGALQKVVAWANERHTSGGGSIKIRLVKGANLAMERVDAAIHGWEQAPYRTKEETDANYKRCIEWALTTDRLVGTRIGIASHNLFDVAWAKLLADDRGVAGRVQFEMLQGMAPSQASAVNEATTSEMLLYTPAVAASDFDVAISYLFRRLEENAADDNFMRSLFELEPGSRVFDQQAARFKQAVADRHTVGSAPQRTQDRTAVPRRPTPAELDAGFLNDPETDPTLPVNHRWIADVMAAGPSPCSTPVTTNIDEVDAHIAATRRGGEAWSRTSTVERQAVLREAAHQLDLRRGELITTMIHEGNKTFAEADGEVCEAIDFARWYANSAAELGVLVDTSQTTFRPLGLLGVIPPWNFPVAIPAGGVLASLAAGNTVIFKPAPETPRCAELVAEALWAAGVPRDALAFVRTPDDETGRHLVESLDAVVLTGASTTAEMFHSWKPDLRLFAETSGKNALIITPHADLDLAAQDLVKSAFGHAGQKCSAASIGILVGEVASSERFRRQLVDAVESLTVGPSTSLGTDIAPLVGGINDRLQRAVDTLEPHESWIVRPTIDGDICTPGIRSGVAVDSWFHQTECFGPVLGLIAANDLDEAIAIANSSPFGLTGGIHSLDTDEVAQWQQRIEVGNGYVNRPITGAIVQRQPFGGWKRSAVGPGAKAGGPNYVMALGTWVPKDNDLATDDFAASWDHHFGIEHDPTGLFCEANIFRYRPLERIIVRAQADADPGAIALVEKAARTCGVEVHRSDAADESDAHFADRLGDLASAGYQRVRIIGTTPPEARLQLTKAATAAGIHLADQPVSIVGRIELQHYVREQAISVTLHRFGNLVNSDQSADQSTTSVAG